MKNTPNTITMITAKLFVQKVKELEGVTIALWTSATTKVEDYHYERCTHQVLSIKQWIETRIQPKIGNIEVRVIDGRGNAAHRARSMHSLRMSYLPEDQQVAIKKSEKKKAEKEAKPLPKGIDPSVNLDLPNLAA